MSATVRRATPILHAGPEAWQSAAAELARPPRCLVVADAGFADAAPDLRGLVADLGTSPGSVVRLGAADDDATSIADLIDVFTTEAPSTVVAFGGGSVLDRVKLACLGYADPPALEAVAVRSRRAGVVSLPSATARKPLSRRVFVPTTIGTGSEVSQVACTTTSTPPGRKRLVTGAALRPDLAVLDPRFTATLPPRLLREGVFEALLRVLGPAIGDDRPDELGDAEAETLTTRLLLVGDQLARGETGPDTRLAAATLSATTHTGWALARREPFSAKHWYLANELATVLGAGKIAATASVLPPVWARIASGDHRYGHPGRLAEVWHWITRLVPGLGEDPVEGIACLMRRWTIEPATVPAEACARAAANAVESWGGPLPMLAGLSVADLEGLYRDATREVPLCST
ncbi:daptide-type RiPP biosynthesis dehydogenase [Amycolatopsis sp. NPDC059021]|uniref:daptide-type RiPP biosynthesis dehydogenase n=1 Tax=Amycolatopsis sp. NPDC059021 TaxID=3346704 RepID=UPI00366D63D6